MGDTLNCDDYGDISSILAASHLNLAQLLVSCPQACAVIVGSGNPDIAGIGAMVAYTIQTTLSFLTPIAISVSLFLHQEPYQSFRGLSQSYMTSQAIFAMAVSISSLVLLVQRPPLIERDLIEKLGAFQALCALQVIYVPTVLSLSEGGFGPNRTKRLWHRIKHSPSTRRILTSVIILPPLLGVAIEYQPDNLRSLYNDAVANPAVCPDHVITRTKAVDGAVVAVLAFVVVVNVIFTVAKTFFGSNSTRRWLLAYGIVSGYSLCVSQALQLGWLFDYRTQARDVAGEEYEDNEWGFGQVLAVFSWAPTLMECGYWFIKTLIHRQDSWRSWRDVKESPWDRDYCSQKRSQAGDGATAIPMLDSER